MQKSRLIPLVLFLGVFTLFAVALMAGKNTRILPSPLIGKQAPVLAGIDLTQGVTLVNFFASWCVPCAAEAPHLELLHQKGVRIIGVSYKDKPDAMQGFLKKFGNPYDEIVIDAKGQSAVEFGVYGVPENFVIHDSIITYKHTGPVMIQDIDVLLEKMGGSKMNSYFLVILNEVKNLRESARQILRLCLRMTNIVILVFSLLISPAHAVQPGEMLKDPALEARAREISANLRCLVCQSESIDDSNADFARDLRVLVRERVMKGESNDQVTAYLKSRYGDFILLEPPVDARTGFLWLLPVIGITAGGLIAFLFYRRRA